MGGDGEWTRRSEGVESDGLDEVDESEEVLLLEPRRRRRVESGCLKSGVEWRVEFENCCRKESTQVERERRTCSPGGRKQDEEREESQSGRRKKDS